jgi:hypothetical protein
MNAFHFTGRNGDRVTIYPTIYNGSHPIPVELAEYSACTRSDNQNGIRSDLAIIRKMGGGLPLDSFDIKITYNATDRQFTLWVRNFSGRTQDTGRASYYAGMIHAYRKLTRKYKLRTVR